MVCTWNSTRSMPSAVGCAASLCTSTMKRARSSFSAGSSAMTAADSADAVFWRLSDSVRAAASKATRAAPTCASNCFSFSSPASRSARSEIIRTASAGSSETGTEYLRLAPRSANRRSSTRSSSFGSNSVLRNARSTAICASESWFSAPSRSSTVSSSRPGASWLLRSSRRTSEAISGTGDALPFKNSEASLMSPAMRSDFIIRARFSASSSSSPSRGLSFSSSSTEERR
ncbi:hypothetical protein D3C72_1483770 [compost metagenome]